MLEAPCKAWDEVICWKCRDYLKLEATRNADGSGSIINIECDAVADPAEAEPACSVCLGLWSDTTADRLLHQLHSACEPYGGMSNNRFATKTLPTIHLPGDIALRYACAAVLSRSKYSIPSSFQLFSKDLKEHIRSHLQRFISQNEDMTLLRDHPKCIESEEQGHLHCHLIATPVLFESRPPSFRLPTPKSNHRKRFRGNDPTEKQGGDPLVNLERRLARAGKELWSMTDVTSVLDQCSIRDEWTVWFQQDQPPSTAVDLHLCIYRSSFFIRGLYTKSRRDVSQTPFYVPGKDSSGNTVPQRKGVTSVEEQINPTIAEISGGISKFNNDGSGSDVVYGMIKFHASGREDLDVRMTLPPEPTEGVGGRPFCLEVVDAFRLPPMESLQEAVLRINHGISQVNVDGNMRYYGVNPLGVGISDCLCFAPSSTFKNLQAETEEKVKYYGCLCWSMAEIPSEEHLNNVLSKCPIALDQRTPIRVVHRRSNIIRRRHVLTLKATKMDDHYFRLNISTDAGTYVKEFVHGDLGRTVPSISSLLGCKTDILELDCEGIKF